MELSRLFFDGKPELNSANFLHMITTMADLGSTEEQINFFIFNSQKVPKLPDGESVWSLSYVRLLTANDMSLQPITLREVNEQNSLKFRRKPSISQNEMDDDSEGIVDQADKLTPISVDVKWTIDDDSATPSVPLVFPVSNDLQEHYGDGCNETDYDMDIKFNPININFGADPHVLRSSNCSKIDHTRYGTASARDAMLTGRLGELVAFKYLIAKAGKSVVKWVNEGIETGLPYDIVVGEKEDSLEFIEVKATQFHKEDWFRISTREWQFAEDKGEAFSILHVLLLGNNAARVSLQESCKIVSAGQVTVAYYDA